MNHYLYIALAVGADAAAIAALKSADGFRAPLPSSLALIGFAAAYFFLSQAVRTLHAKGLRRSKILFKHGLRNVGVTLLTVTGLLLDRKSVV